MSNSGAHLESKIDFQQIVGQNPGKPAADLRWRSEGTTVPEGAKIVGPPQKNCLDPLLGGTDQS